MNPVDKTLQSSLSGMLGTTPYDHEEIATLRQRAWIEQGLLIVSPLEPRLNAEDTRTLTRIARTLYGEGGEQ
jgi:hypothetical protein